MRDPRLFTLVLTLAAGLWIAACYPAPDDDDASDDDDNAADDDVADDDDDTADDDDVTDDDDDVTDDDDDVTDDDDDTSGPPLIGAGEILVTEVMYNPSAANDSDGEWFEIRNMTGGSLNLQGCTFADLGSNSFTVSSSLVVTGNGYAVLGKSDDTGINGGVPVDYGYGGSMSLNQSDDQIILTCGAGEVTRLQYDTGAGWAGDDGVSMSLDPDEFGNGNLSSSWCDATSAIGNGDLGTPGSINDECGGGPSTVNPNDVVFTEVMQNPDAVGDSEGEWFEVFNRSGGPVDLGGCIVRDDGSNSFTISGSLTAPPGGYLLLAKNGDFGVNGGVVADYEYGSSDLGNTDDELILECGGVEIDRIEWDGGPGWPDPTGASMTLDESFLMNNNDGARWCEATSSFGMGDLGTPGDPNDPC